MWFQEQQRQQLVMTQDLLKWLREHQFSFLAEFLLAWLLVLTFSISYIIDYLQALVEMKILKQNVSQWCHKIPITPLPQTKRRFSVSTLCRLQELLERSFPNSKEPHLQADGGWCWSDEQVCDITEKDVVARNLASLIMAEPSSSEELSHPLLRQLKRLWPRLLNFPTTPCGERQEYDISLIVPAYKEKAEDIQYTLSNALENCGSPQIVQVVVVDAGGCDKDLSKVLSCESWGSLEVHSYNGVGGRGGTLNFGASKATGSILTFLHSDTLLPNQWDTMIQSTFAANTIDKVRVSACAFSMGIDLSPRGLRGGRCPPGIVGADRILGYLRCKLCMLPYGDSVLSFPSRVFQYLGGYPDQPLMEDFEIMSLLRNRAQLLDDEAVAILPARIQCSPRRWQNFGVCYTILVNALCIRRYKSGATTEDLFELYYNQPMKKTS